VGHRAGQAAHRGTSRDSKYSFENRTSGGVIQFNDYDASVTFRKREMRHNLLGKLFLGVLVTGVFCLVCAFLAFKD